MLWLTQKPAVVLSPLVLLHIGNKEGQHCGRVGLKFAVIAQKPKKRPRFRGFLNGLDLFRSVG